MKKIDICRVENHLKQGNLVDKRKSIVKKDK